MEKHILTKNGMFQAQVCSNGTFNEALEWLKTTNPAGTSGNWQKDESKAMSPVECNNDQTRYHYMFIC